MSDQQPFGFTTSDEFGIGYDVPAPYANRVFVTTHGDPLAIVRLAFTEQYDPSMPPLARVAVSLAPKDALDTARLIYQLVLGPEAAKAAEDAAIRAAGGSPNGG